MKPITAMIIGIVIASYFMWAYEAGGKYLVILFIGMIVMGIVINLIPINLF